MEHFHSNCLICRSDVLKPLEQFKDHHLVRCGNCGFVFAQAAPTAEALSEYYSDYPVKSHRSPITIKRYQELLKKFEPFRRTNKLLDTGCGTGYFLDEAKKLGWEVYGTEYSPESIEACRSRGIIIHEGSLQKENYQSEQFDVITSFEVIEHINDPTDEVSIVNNILRKGGLFYVTTPNFNSISRNMVGSKWNIVNYPEHLSYYTPSTLSRLLTQQGFEKSWIKTTGISVSRFKTSKELDEQENVSPDNDDEKLRTRMEHDRLLKFMKSVMNAFLNLFKKGDSLKAGFIKK